MGYLNRYLKRTNQGNPDAADAPFIEKALNKIEIEKMENGEPSNQPLEAVLIFKDKDGPDTGILYTYEKDGLEVGDTIIKRGARVNVNAYYTIVEEVKRVDGSVKIRVFNALEANSWAAVRQQVRPAYVISNLKNQIRNEGESIISEVKKATMVAPSADGYKINDILNLTNIISNEESSSSWKIDGKDDITTPYIVYLHLTQVLKNTEPIVQGRPAMESTSLKKGSELTLDSVNGYITSSERLNIVDRTETSVRIRLPLYSIEFDVDLKTEEGTIKTETIKVGD